MLRRPVGLLPTVLERAGQRGALAQSGMCSGVQAMAMEPCVQTQVQEMLPRAAIAAATPTADAMFGTLPLAPVARVVDGVQEGTACARATAPGMVLLSGVPAARGIFAGQIAHDIPWGAVTSEVPSTENEHGDSNAAESFTAARVDNHGEQKTARIVKSSRGLTLARKQVTHYRCLACAALVNSVLMKTSCGCKVTEKAGLLCVCSACKSI